MQGPHTVIHAAADVLFVPLRLWQVFDLLYELVRHLAVRRQFLVLNLLANCSVCGGGEKRVGMPVEQQEYSGRHDWALSCATLSSVRPVAGECSWFWSRLGYWCSLHDCGLAAEDVGCVVFGKASATATVTVGAACAHCTVHSAHCTACLYLQACKGTGRNAHSAQCTVHRLPLSAGMQRCRKKCAHTHCARVAMHTCITAGWHTVRQASWHAVRQAGWQANWMAYLHICDGMHICMHAHHH
eukprot:357308-Chlamydomonas_euryale.AAC.14